MVSWWRYSINPLVGKVEPKVVSCKCLMLVFMDFWVGFKGFIHFSFVQRCRNVHKNSSVSEGESPPRRRRTSRCFGWNAGTCVVRRRPTCRLRREGFSPRRFPTFEWFPWLNRRRFVRRKSRNTHGKLMDDGCASWWLDGWCESDNRCSELTHGFLWCELKKKTCPESWVWMTRNWDWQKW